MPSQVGKHYVGLSDSPLTSPPDLDLSESQVLSRSLCGSSIRLGFLHRGRRRVEELVPPKVPEPPLHPVAQIAGAIHNIRVRFLQDLRESGDGVGHPLQFKNIGKNLAAPFLVELEAPRGVKD